MDENGQILYQMAEEMRKYFNEKGIPNRILLSKGEKLSTERRIEEILGSSPNRSDTIILTLQEGTSPEIEIQYALRNTDKLASRIASSLEEGGYSVSKYYQLRDPKNPLLDAEPLLKETGNRESILVNYGNLPIENSSRLATLTAEALGFYLEKVGTFYTVLSGDSLYSIARKFGVSVEAIKEANQLATNFLSIGQTLRIPDKQEESSNSEEYIVKSGDTLYGIANTYGISVEELKSANQLSSNLLTIGQTLVIPKNTTPSQKIYVVQKGDSLYSIATKYGVTVAELKSLNNLSSNLLSIGQQLKIPNTTKEIVYLVQKGDNLYSIARKYNLSTEEVMKINHLTTTLLSIGQKLIIPIS